jgi:cell division protein FtsQ
MGATMDRPEGFITRPQAAHKTAKKVSQRPTAKVQQQAATKKRVASEKAELRRFTQARRHRRMVWGVSLGSVGALVLAVALLTLSPALSLRYVVVEGTNRLSAEDVEQALAGLYGEPLARVSTDRVQAALAPLTLIQAFETRIEPPHTLVVSIVERRAIGVVGSASSYVVVDAAGVELWEEFVVPKNLPIILVAADPESPSFSAIARVLLALPDDTLSQVEGVTATTLDDVRFTMRGASHEVVWGSADRAAEKSRVLRAALITAGANTSQVIDVTTPDSVVIRAKG